MITLQAVILPVSRLSICLGLLVVVAYNTHITLRRKWLSAPAEPAELDREIDLPDADTTADTACAPAVPVSELSPDLGRPAVQTNSRSQHCNKLTELSPEAVATKPKVGSSIVLPVSLGTRRAVAGAAAPILAVKAAGFSAIGPVAGAMCL